MKVTAEREGGAKVEVDYDFGEDLDQLVNKFGADVVFSHARRSFVVTLQSFIRTQMDRGKSETEIQEAVNEWRPGQRKQGKSPQEKVQDMLAKMDPSARAALLKEYRAREKAQAAA